MCKNVLRFEYFLTFLFVKILKFQLLLISVELTLLKNFFFKWIFYFALVNQKIF